MPEEITEEPFSGSWRKIGDRIFSCYVLPASLPTWVPMWSDGLVGGLMGIVMFSLHAKPPWVVVVYRARPRFTLWFPVLHREEFATLREANIRARQIDADLRAGAPPRPDSE
jgi:hypothetical protein